MDTQTLGHFALIQTNRSAYSTFHLFPLLMTSPSSPAPNQDFTNAQAQPHQTPTTMHPNSTHARPSLPVNSNPILCHPTGRHQNYNILLMSLHTRLFSWWACWVLSSHRSWSLHSRRPGGPPPSTRRRSRPPCGQSTGSQQSFAEKKIILRTIRILNKNSGIWNPTIWMDRMSGTWIPSVVGAWIPNIGILNKLKYLTFWS